MKALLAAAVILVSQGAFAANNSVLKCSDGASLLIYEDTNQPVQTVLTTNAGKNISLSLYNADGANIGNVYKLGTGEPVGTYVEGYTPRTLRLNLQSMNFGTINCTY